MPPGRSFPGELEQMVLLAILQADGQAFALEVRREISASARRDLSRSAFYTTLERLERKGMVRWTEAVPDDARSSAPLRRYQVTPEGLDTLRHSRRALLSLWRGLDTLLESP
jgi:PadR family transcriptional regulator, regulatory protein PadR